MNAILYNGRIYPQCRVQKRPSIVVITGDRIQEVGEDLSYFRRRYPGYQQINLDGRAVIPGFVDSHTHFHFWASRLDTVHLDGTRSFADALKIIEQFAHARRENDWIIGDGWSADRWEPYHLPNAAELDPVTGGRPAALYSKDTHILWVNSQALRLAGIDKNTPDPAGGWIDRDPQTGAPTGILRENPAHFLVTRLISRSDPDRMDALWDEAARIARSRGVTGFHSVENPEGWAYFQQRHRQGNLGFRVHYYYPVAMLDELINGGVSSGQGDDTLRVGGVKIFTDGSLGAQTALMKEPYVGKPDQVGVEVTSLDELVRIIGKAAGHNLACAIHAIGDRAVANVIMAHEIVGRKENLRHRIEHVQLISRNDIPRLRKTGVIASMQPTHCPSDRELVARYWGKRGRNAFVFKTILKNNIPLTFGSDCPIEPLNPIDGIHAAVNRTGYGERGGRFYPEECLTVAEAVYGFTAGPAYASGRDAFAGKIVPGFQADLAILDDDIYSMPKSKLYTARVAATIFSGHLAYRTPSFPAVD